MQKSNINPRCLQQMLESAPNAAEKGQSQFFTPHAFGAALAKALPKLRPTILDLNCGDGDLLQASVSPDTERLLGSDIDPDAGGLTSPRREAGEKAKARRLDIRPLHWDLTHLYPAMVEIDFTADLFVLNPPFRLWWDRARLQDLAASDLTAVREAFAAQEAAAYKKGTVDGTIDSTIATLLMALDRCTYLGEGLLIGNNATLQRLLFDPDAPHAAVARHVWGHLIVPGNPMTGLDDCLWEKETAFHTGVLYFARGHLAGPETVTWPADWAARLESGTLPLPDRLYRNGSSLCYTGHARERVADDWKLLRDRAAELNTNTGRQPYHLWLNVGGRIGCNLTDFEQRSVKVNKAEAQRLYALRGKTPMELVIQRAQRDELRHVVHQGGWRVEPALLEAVEKAVGEYNAARAPLYPLDPIKRLGYLDEQDTIECTKDLMGVKAESGKRKAETENSKLKTQNSEPAPQLLFKAGQRYSIRTQTVAVIRRSWKYNPLMARDESLEHTGQELAIYLADGVRDPHAKEDKLTEYCFMDAKIMKDKNTTVKTAPQQKGRNDGDPVGISFTLQELAAHFAIPEVPDVATANPAGYRRNLDALAAIEQLTEGLAA